MKNAYLSTNRVANNKTARTALHATRTNLSGSFATQAFLELRHASEIFAKDETYMQIGRTEVVLYHLG